MIALVCALLLSFSFVSANEANQQYFRVGLGKCSILLLYVSPPKDILYLTLLRLPSPADEALPGGDNLRRATKKAKQGQGREKDGKWTSYNRSIFHHFSHRK